MIQQETRVHTDAGRVLLARALVHGLSAAEALTHLAIGSWPGVTLVKSIGTGSNGNGSGYEQHVHAAEVDDTLAHAASVVRFVTALQGGGGTVYAEGAGVNQWTLTSDGTLHWGTGTGGFTFYIRYQYLELQLPSRSGTVVQERGRVAFQERRFVTDTGAPSAVPTNRIYFRFRFESAQALGNWRQFGLFGGGVAYLQRGATLIDIGSPVGDDRAVVPPPALPQVVLSGAYTPAESQRITVTCTLGGGEFGAAGISWVSSGSVAAGGADAPFNVPILIPGSGLALTFTGGADGVLTQGAQWEIRGTRSAVSGTYAAGGVYDAISNPTGQVLAGGTCFELFHHEPAFVKGAAAIDVQLICEVLSVS